MRSFNHDRSILRPGIPDVSASRTSTKIFDPQDPRRHTILNPKVIVEVLSPSTEAYDRGDKFTQYRMLKVRLAHPLKVVGRRSIATYISCNA